jgi:hypothetical protein
MSVPSYVRRASDRGPILLIQRFLHKYIKHVGDSLEGEDQGEFIRIFVLMENVFICGPYQFRICRSLIRWIACIRIHVNSIVFVVIIIAEVIDRI